MHTSFCASSKTHTYTDSLTLITMRKYATQFQHDLATPTFADDFYDGERCSLGLAHSVRNFTKSMLLLHEERNLPKFL